MSRPNNTSKRGRGRPQSSDRVRIVPIPHADPDPRKLGRAFLALALYRGTHDATDGDTKKEANDESA